MWQKDIPLTRIGALEALVFDESPKAKVTVLFLHGYGADAYDLASLRGELNLVPKPNWQFAQGPLQVEIGPGFYGRAWFPIDIEAHELAMRTGQDLSYAEKSPRGMAEAKAKVLNFLDAQNISSENLILGGFSQGAMLALNVALHLKSRPLGLALLSSTLTEKSEILRLAKASPGFRFFQSHGEADGILPFSGAEALRGVLVEAGWDDIWSPFNGGHEIPRSVLRDLSSYLKSCLKNVK